MGRFKARFSGPVKPGSTCIGTLNVQSFEELDRVYFQCVDFMLFLHSPTLFLSQDIKKKLKNKGNFLYIREYTSDTQK